MKGLIPSLIATGAVVLCVTIAGRSANAKEFPRFGVFVFSDECVQKNASGDVVGERITLLRFPAGDMAIYQYGVGAFGGPILADKVSINQKHGSIRIEVVDQFGIGATADRPGVDTVEGTISTSGLIIKYGGAGKARTLPRMAGLPKPIPTCK